VADGEGSRVLIDGEGVASALVPESGVRNTG
jgi:hypothetical protein